jgi:DNA-directed RNA polymerase subunit M/transcription elongation factor TFIIS
VTMPEMPRQYPVICPKCSQDRGYPFQVQTIAARANQIEVRLRCRDCSHEWVEVVSSKD